MVGNHLWILQKSETTDQICSAVTPFTWATFFPSHLSDAVSRSIWPVSLKIGIVSCFGVMFLKEFGSTKLFILDVKRVIDTSDFTLNSGPNWDPITKNAWSAVDQKKWMVQCSLCKPTRPKSPTIYYYHIWFIIDFLNSVILFSITNILIFNRYFNWYTKIPIIRFYLYHVEDFLFC